MSATGSQRLPGSLHVQTEDRRFLSFDLLRPRKASCRFKQEGLKCSRDKRAATCGQLTIRRRPKQDPHNEPAERTFARTLRCFLLKGVVPLTGLEPVTPALRRLLKQNSKGM